MKFTRLIPTLAFALLTGLAMAAAATPVPAGMTAVPLATITNDRDPSVSQIKLLVNANAKVRGIYLQTRPSADSSPIAAKSKVYWLAGIESDHGVVLGQGQGVKAIFLRGNIESQAGSGSLVIRYLKNGLFRHYSECRIGLKRISPYHWQLVNAYDHQPIEHIKVETWALGISTLTNVCPSGTA